MRYDVASALAEKSRFEGGKNAQSLKYATELSKTLHFNTEIHSSPSNIFGKCLRVTSREGVALDFFPEKDIVVASSSDFTASYKASEYGDRMFVAVKNADGLYIKILDTKHGESVVFVESSFWAQDTLEYVTSKNNPLSRTTLQVNTSKAAYDYASQTVAPPKSKAGFVEDYNSEDFGKFIADHEQAEAEEKARLDQYLKQIISIQYLVLLKI